MGHDVLVISTSLNPESRSRILAQAALAGLTNKCDVWFIDLADYQLPICDGAAAYEVPDVGKLTDIIKSSKAILLAVPVYNFAGSASAKNLIELTGSAWEDKIVGFLCAAGGRSSYMSIMGLANSLMLDFRCVINPRFVYADGSAFEADSVTDKKIKARIEELITSTLKLAGIREEIRA
jgi:NAD(P)H-dependent FMN reductase